MNGQGEALAAAAERLLGVPFRLHGRDPWHGLDCVGFVAAALAAIGRTVRTPTGYQLRQADIGRYLPFAGPAGLVEAQGPQRAGDILLARPGPAQFHLLIAARRELFVHAHAGLGRVVATPAPLPWPIERHWRLLP